MILEKTHAYISEKNFPKLSLQLDNPLHFHLFSLYNCLSSLCWHRFQWFPIFIGRWIVVCKAAIHDFTFFAFFIFLLKWLIKQISEPLHTKMIHRVQSRQLLDSKIKSGSVFCDRLEYFAVFFNPIFDVFRCQQFVVDVIRNLFWRFKFIDKIIRLEDVLTTIS